MLKKGSQYYLELIFLTPRLESLSKVEVGQTDKKLNVARVPSYLLINKEKLVFM